MIPPLMLMRFRFLMPALALAVVSCGRSPESDSAASKTEAEAAAKRAESAKRYDREHDAVMRDATHGSIPDPRPAGALK